MITFVYYISMNKYLSTKVLTLAAVVAVGAQIMMKHP